MDGRTFRPFPQPRAAPAARVSFHATTTREPLTSTTPREPVAEIDARGGREEGADRAVKAAAKVARAAPALAPNTTQ